MIYIRIELWPKGNERQAILLHEGAIANDGSGSKSVGNYTYTFGRRGSGFLRGNWQGSVEGFKRQSQTAWRLLYEALHDHFGNK